MRPINIFFTCTGSETWARDTGPGAGLLCASPAPRHWLDLKQQNGALGQPPLPAMEVPDLPACGPCAVTAEPPPTSPALQHPHHSLWSMRAGLKLGLRPDLQKGCLGSPGGQLGLGSPSSLTCVQGLWSPQRRGSWGGWPAIHHMHTALLSLLGRQPLLQGFNEELLLLHTDQASLQGKNEMVQIPRAQQTKDGQQQGGSQGTSHQTDRTRRIFPSTPVRQA